MLSFNKIWKRIRHHFEFAGIVCGVGALFLAIPVPEKTQAANALLQLQFLWLLFIAIAVTSLLIQIGLIFSEIQTNVEQRFNGSFYIFGSPVFIVGVLLIVFCINIWNYAVAIYPVPFIHFAFLLASFMSALCLFVIEILIRKYLTGLTLIPKAIVYAIPLGLFGYLCVALAFQAFSFARFSIKEPHFWLWQAADALFYILLSFLLTLQTLRHRAETRKEIAQVEETKDVIQ